MRGSFPAVLRTMITKTAQEPSKPGKTIGYIRVSRSRQNTARQEDAMAAARISTVFSDKISGKKWKRAGLDAALAIIGPGDKLAVEAIDRLGRTAFDILATIEALKARGASLISLSDHCDSATSNGSVQMLFLAVLSEIEHMNITRRTQDGVAAAMARGRRRGGKPKMTCRQASQAQRLIESGMSADRVAARFNVGRSTLYRHLNASLSPSPCAGPPARRDRETAPSH